jgi:hypothetical protein
MYHQLLVPILNGRASLEIHHRITSYGGRGQVGLTNDLKSQDSYAMLICSYAETVIDMLFRCKERM